MLVATFLAWMSTFSNAAGTSKRNLLWIIGEDTCIEFSAGPVCSASRPTFTTAREFRRPTYGRVTIPETHLHRCHSKAQTENGSFDESLHGPAKEVQALSGGGKGARRSR